MDNDYSVNSPRRVLSFSRRASASFLDSDEKRSFSSGFGLSEEQHGPKPSEVYGFVGSITTVVATVIFLAWAYLPDRWLHAVGIYYYPNRYWALAVPTYIMVTIILGLVFYVGLNFMATPHKTSLYTLFDENSREPCDSFRSSDGEEQPIKAISDISISEINALMFDNM